ncbi:hypothetical protein [Streptomyces prunicolor]|uniref:hypothetical protein n=1 Tax=Streptomyces prunicolor TaxID=67348 RepID=UPI00037EE19D|nr:hypothetical protein [Streptomyces prunicolor]
MTLLDDIARASRASRVHTPQTELRYHGGPLDGQAHTWPLTAVPPQIPLAPSAGRPGGRYLLAGGADDPDFSYHWTPDAPELRPGSAAHDAPTPADQLIELPAWALAIRADFQDSRGRHASLHLDVPPLPHE